MDGYEQHDALGLAALVRDREVSPTELLDEALARVEARNPELNAVIRLIEGRARAAIEAGLPDGPFRGVPFLLKDLRAGYGGVPTQAGSRFMHDNVPGADSELVKRYKDAGLVIFGKTNTSEFGGAPTTEPREFGPTRNPWDTERSAGGSSGGSATAVAAGMVPAAHGGDGGGSVRIPAGCCGLVGLKPTRGRNPAGPEGEGWNGLSAEHVITRSVRDSAAFLDATAGPALGDPYAVPPPARPFLDEVGVEPGRLRVAVQRAPASGAPVHSDCVAAVDAAAEMLSDLGHEVVEGAPSYDGPATGAAFRLLVAANVQSVVDEHAERVGREQGPDDLERVIGILGEEGHQADATQALRAIRTMHRTGRQVAPFFEEHDVLLTPTVATPPPPLGLIDTMSEDVDAYLETVFGFIPFTALANIVGSPAIALPLHWNVDGLPISVHFMAGYARDDLLFRLAGQLEQARPWFDRRPPG